MSNSHIEKILDLISALSEDIRAEKALSVNAEGIGAMERAVRFTQASSLVNLTQLVTVHLMRDGAASYDGDSRRAVLSDIDVAICDVRGLQREEIAREIQDLAGRAVHLAGVVTGERKASIAA